MKFTQLVSGKMNSLLTAYDMEIMEQSENTIAYRSQKLSILFVHDPRENAPVLWINGVEIDDQVMEQHFNSAQKLKSASQEAFIDNVFLFFMTTGAKLLEGEEYELISLQQFNEQRSKEYTEQLEEQQSLEAAEIAWKNGNFQDVVSYLEKIGEDKLSTSLRQKYSIAKRRMNN